MNKVDIDKELAELIGRFRRLKKAIEEENNLSTAQRAAIAEAQAFTKTLTKKEPDPEAIRAQHLAQLLKKRGILGSRPPPRQPTDEEMFGHLVPPADVVEKAEKDWGNAINNWMREATKPISSRFKTPEEEKAYWDSIKVTDSGGDNSGY